MAVRQDTALLDQTLSFFPIEQDEIPALFQICGGTLFPLIDCFCAG
jgi:hypothetical protein